MFELLIIIGLIFCFSNIYKLNREVDSLKKSIEGKSYLNPTSHTAAPAPQVAPTPMYSAEPFSSAVPAPARPYEAPEPSAFIEWLKQDPLVKVGALLLVIAFGWFVSYAFANNWIGPVGRITLGLMAGVAFMFGGVIRIKTMKSQGSIFAVLGSAIVVLTVYAAREMYDMFTPTSALAIMFLSVVFIAWLSVMYKSKSMALAGLVMAGLAPILTNSPEPSALDLFSYLAVIVLGSLWVLSKIEAVALQFAAFIMVVLYSLPYLSYGPVSSEKYIALGFGFLFTVIFFLSNITSILKRRGDEADTTHILVAVGSGLYLAGWISEVVPHEWKALIYTAWAAVFAFGAFIVFMRTSKRIPFYLYGSISIGLLAAATAVIFEGPVLTLVYTLEITILVALAAYLIKNSQAVSRLSFLFIGPILISLDSLSGYGWSNPFGEEFAILFTLAMCLGLSAYIVRVTSSRASEEKDSTSVVLAFLSSFYVTALVWLVTHSIFLDDDATMISLLIYTVTGLGLYVYGKTNENLLLKKVGMIAIGLVVARLLLVDVWQMAIAGRIVTFLSIGVLLISTAFIKKFNDHTK